MSIAWEWHTLCPSSDGRFLVQGTELACAYVPGTRSRLLVYEVRTVTRDAEGPVFDRRYVMRDADRVTDAEVRDGKRPPVVGTWDTLEEVEAAVEKARRVG